ncbi:hypothetical protein R3P38DRAFT_2925636 [Favolaschia claudopus]|uniref:F-box domain-containing protein n=1 Tax=Favolaschia claudopus TaxID=2862362 RepID=A0AAW0C194_9AGAR
MAGIPQLPVELLMKIISTFWHMPLSATERIIFMRSSALVNSTWAEIYSFESSRDVYIPSAAFCDHFIERIRPPRATTTRTAAPSYAGSFMALFLPRPKQAASASMHPRSSNLMCESITIQITNEDVHPPKDRLMRMPMGGVLDTLLETVDAWSLVPNLQRLSVEYMNAGFDDIFARAGFAPLPEQITHLDVRYSFSDAMPIWLAESLHRKQAKRRRLRWRAVGISYLSISGAGENTVADLLAACPNVRRMEVDSLVFKARDVPEQRIKRSICRKYYEAPAMAIKEATVNSLIFLLHFQIDPCRSLLSLWNHIHERKIEDKNSTCSKDVVWSCRRKVREEPPYHRRKSRPRAYRAAGA